MDDQQAFDLDVLMEQQRYDEAVGSFESGVPYWPQRGGYHPGIAATLLRQGGRAAEALGRATLAVGDGGYTPAAGKLTTMLVGVGERGWFYAPITG